jgi:hypothetical protein
MKATALGILLLAAGPAAADQARCIALDKAMPGKLHGYALADRGAYDNPALGFHLRYEAAGGGWATVYLFDAGQARVDGGTVQAYFEGGIGDIETLHRRNGHDGARDFVVEETGLGTALDRVFAVTTDLPGGGSQRDWLAMGQSGDCMVKLRHTAGPDAGGQSDFDAVARALARAVSP